MKIGIYDSGIGGLSVLHRALKKMPEAEFIYYADTKHVPYGEKTREQIKGYVEEVLNFLIAKEVDAIVIACNTATSVATKEFRGEFAVPIVGMEPAVKRALKLYQDMQKRILAQCTDARVNVVVEGLFAKYPTVEALAEADVNNIEEIVRPCGLGKSKARDISACMKMLRDEYGGKIPKDFNAILKLPGVGRKSANLIMGDVFGEPAIVTDTHCIRLVNRIGLVDGIKDPKKVEMELWKLVPPEEGSDFCHRLVYHGREVCTARTKPHCDRCCLADICKKVGVEK